MRGALRPQHRPTSWRRPGWGAVVVVASGPSFTEEQARAITAARVDDRCRVIVVNDNWRRVHNADALYASDGNWWKHNYADVALGGFGGELWTQDFVAARRWNLRAVRGYGNRPGLCATEGEIHTGGSSGMAAINLAFQFGAERIVLVGFDMKVGPAGEKHWFGSHRVPELDRGGARVYAHWVTKFGPFAADLARFGVQVFNASTDSALECFPRAPLERALAPSP